MGSNAGHHHHHHHHHAHGKASSSIVKVFGLNLGFSILELIGGLWTGSVALIADALHDFGDALVIGLAYLFERKAESAPDKKFSYGYRRYSLVSALITGVVLLVGSTLVILFAAQRFMQPEELKTLPMIVFAFIGVAVNGASYLQMRADRQHSAQMLRWHLLEDAAGWVAVLIGSVVMHFTGWFWLDGVLAIGIAAWILWGVGRSLWDTVQVFLQKVPENMNTDAIKEDLLKIEGIDEIHDLHLWSLDGDIHVLSLHVVRSRPSLELAEIKSQIRLTLRKWGKIHSTIEIEDHGENCVEQC